MRKNFNLYTWTLMLLTIIATLGCSSCSTETLPPPVVVVPEGPLLLYMDGQSNNMGRGPVADLPAYLKLPMTAANTGGGTVYIWAPANGQVGSAGTWQVLEAGVNQKGYALTSAGTIDNTEHGPEMELGYQTTKNYGVDVYIVKTGRGGRPLYATTSIEDFNVSTTGELHDEFENRATAAEAALAAQGISYTKAGWFWMQGEYDARTGNDAYAAAYEQNLINKVAAVRAITGTPDLPVVIGRLRTGIVRDPALIPVVQGAQESVAAADPDAEVVNTDSFPLLSDNLHFSSAGFVMLGNAYYQMFTVFHPKN